MKQTFTKYFGRITEKLEMNIEDKWIYVYYKKGNFEKTACILKNTEKSQQEYLDTFYKENGVSEPMKKEVEKYFMNVKETDSNSHWKEFTSFLMKALSLHMAIGVTVALTLFAGYELGAYLDGRFDTYPVYTLIGIVMGIGVGGYTGYSMIRKYTKPAGGTKQEEKNRNIKPAQLKVTEDLSKYPVIDVTLEEVRKAVREFSDQLPKGVYRTILVKDDNSIDFTQLAHIMKGIPAQKFYMSRETYDLFEEKDKHIAVEMDMVQKAVDLYVKDHKEYPMLQFDPQRRVNYYQLIQEHYLKTAPELQFYITDLDGLVTHVKPEKKLGNSS